MQLERLSNRTQRESSEIHRESAGSSSIRKREAHPKVIAETEKEDKNRMTFKGHNNPKGGVGGKADSDGGAGNV